ncbi:MAG: hypothetical protein F6K14_08350 [Symploca sp. SIO2C1]|nr:hypothetical protein [Symploca sp. SIO2C1]
MATIASKAYELAIEWLEERDRHGHIQWLIKVPATPANWVPVEHCDDGD